MTFVPIFQHYYFFSPVTDIGPDVPHIAISATLPFEANPHLAPKITATPPILRQSRSRSIQLAVVRAKNPGILDGVDGRRRDKHAHSSRAQQQATTLCPGLQLRAAPDRDRRLKAWGEAAGDPRASGRAR